MLKGISKSKIIDSAPIIIGFIFVIFIASFSLDVIQPNSTLGQIIIGLILHNIPALFLLLMLIMSKRHELFSGIGFILAGLLYVLLLITSSGFKWYMLFWVVIVSGLAFLVGLLFIFNYLRRRGRK